MKDQWIDDMTGTDTPARPTPSPEEFSLIAVDCWTDTTPMSPRQPP